MVIFGYSAIYSSDIVLRMRTYNITLIPNLRALLRANYLQVQ
jgi:hypothetical protein